MSYQIDYVVRLGLIVSFIICILSYESVSQTLAHHHNNEHHVMRCKVNDPGKTYWQTFYLFFVSFMCIYFTITFKAILI